MISALAACACDASAAKRIISTAPIAKFGRHEHVGARRTPCAAPRSRSPVVPDHDVHAGLDGRARVARARCRAAVKSTTTSASPSTSGERRAERRVGAAASSMSSAPSTARAHGLPHAPGGAGDRDADHAASAATARRRRPRARGGTPPRRGRCRPRDSALGRPQLADAARATSSSVTASMRAITSSSAEQRHARQHRRAEPVHARRGRLQRQHHAALDVLARALELRLGDGVLAQARELVGDDPHRLGDVVRARADVQADLAGVGVLAGERVDASRPARASRAPPGTAATRTCRRGSCRARAARSGGRRRAGCPGAPRQTWYCSVSLRRKRTRGARRRRRRGAPAPARRRRRRAERLARPARRAASWSTEPAAAMTTLPGT